MSLIDQLKFPMSQIDQLKFPMSQIDQLKFPMSQIDQLKFPMSQIDQLKFPMSQIDQLKFPMSQIDQLKFPKTYQDCVLHRAAVGIGRDEDCCWRRSGYYWWSTSLQPPQGLQPSYTSQTRPGQAHCTQTQQNLHLSNASRSSTLQYKFVVEMSNRSQQETNLSGHLSSLAGGQ